MDGLKVKPKNIDSFENTENTVWAPAGPVPSPEVCVVAA